MQLFGVDWTVSTKPDVELAWYHGPSKVSLADDVRYRMDSENCLYRLVIMGVTVSDAGDWRCLATNSYGQCISACRLDVVGSSFVFFCCNELIFNLAVLCCQKMSVHHEPVLCQNGLTYC